MTGEQIRERVERYVDDSTDDLDALAAINEALAILGDQGLIYETLGFIADAGVWYNLPIDCTYVSHVTRSIGANTFSSYINYQIEGNSILFSDDGSYIIHYRRNPASLTSLAQSPDVHQSFHQCIVTYCKSWFKLKDDDESQDGLRLAQQWERDIQRVYNALNRKRSPKQVQVIRHA